MSKLALLSKIEILETLVRKCENETESADLLGDLKKLAFGLDELFTAVEIETSPTDSNSAIAVASIEAYADMTLQGLQSLENPCDFSADGIVRQQMIDAQRQLIMKIFDDILKLPKVKVQNYETD